MAPSGLKLNMKLTAENDVALAHARAQLRQRPRNAAGGAYVLSTLYFPGPTKSRPDQDQAQLDRAERRA